MWGDNGRGQLGELAEEDLRGSNKKKLKKKKSAKMKKMKRKKSTGVSSLLVPGFMTSSDALAEGIEKLTLAHIPVRVRGSIENGQVIRACCSPNAVLALVRMEAPLAGSSIPRIVKLREPYNIHVPTIVRKCCAYIKKNGG